MLKKISTILLVLGLFLTVANAQWTGHGAFPDTSSAYAKGNHGVAVDPDGKIWAGTYYKHLEWVTDNNDTLATAGVYVFNPDGTQTDFSPITHFIYDNGFSVDTINAVRGVAKDNDGNILITTSANSNLVKVDYKTGEVLGLVYVYDHIGSSPTAPTCDDNGNIYVGPVVGGEGKAIAMYDKDLNYVGNAVTAPPAISRTMQVSKDGNTIYWLPFTARVAYIYTRADEFSDFEMSDSTMIGMAIESSVWHPTTNELYVSSSHASDSTYAKDAWYSFNAETKQIRKEFTWKNGVDVLPRGIDFTTDGQTAYVGAFTTETTLVEKFTNPTVSVEQLDNGIVPEGYALEQNYPNPFNPTTKIKFQVADTELVTVKVYNMLGQEVAILHNEITEAGTYVVNFDASELASGMYVYTINAGSFTASKKMMLVK